MEIESPGCKVDVVEKAELENDEHVGEGGLLKAVRVELGVAGKGKSSSKVFRVSWLSGLSEMEEIGRGKASKMKV